VARVLTSNEVEAGVAYHLVVLCDEDVDENVPTPDKVGHAWLSTGASTVLLQSAGDIGTALFTLELWDDQPPSLDQVVWPASESVTLRLPSGILCVRQMAMGRIPAVFDVSEPGTYRVRLAWREDHEGFLLAQFWAGR
jgi:hypothetical protein